MAGIAPVQLLLHDLDLKLRQYEMRTMVLAGVELAIDKLLRAMHEMSEEQLRAFRDNYRNNLVDSRNTINSLLHRSSTGQDDDTASTGSFSQSEAETARAATSDSSDDFDNARVDDDADVFLRLQQLDLTASTRAHIDPDDERRPLLQNNSTSLVNGIPGLRPIPGARGHVPIQTSATAFGHPLSVPQKDRLRRLRDRLCAAAGIMPGSGRAGPLLQQRFHAFISGITLFDGQDVFSRDPRWRHHPHYHRQESCGDGTAEFRTRMRSCRHGMTPDERFENVKRVTTCYTERLIFDFMYTNEIAHVPLLANNADRPTQDERHLNQLRQVRADFQTCFPQMDLRVADMVFELGALGEQIPVAVVLEYVQVSNAGTLLDNARVLRTDAYRRTWQFFPGEQRFAYNHYVTCYREDADGRKWSKVQSSQAEQAWRTEVTPRQVGGRRSSKKKKRRTAQASRAQLPCLHPHPRM